MSRVTALLTCFLALASGCTYGPEQSRASIGQIVRVGDSYRALVVISYERFQNPTGLSAFPDGGKRRVHERHSTLYLVDASDRSASALFLQAAPDSLWESFDVSVGGIDAEGVAYLRVAGCPRGGECGSQLRRTVYYRVTPAGHATQVAELPASASLPGVMLARLPGETQYVRFSRDGNVITGRFEEGGRFEPLFAVRDNGSVEAVGG